MKSSRVIELFTTQFSRRLVQSGNFDGRGNFFSILENDGLYQMSTMQTLEKLAYTQVIDSICDLRWEKLSQGELIDVAWAYYFFSVQFRENLQTARHTFPDDSKLMHLEREECETDNLSPWPGVAAAGEKLNHDEFMKRLLSLSDMGEDKRRFFERRGDRYLNAVRQIDPLSRALSIASYEDGGLESVFRAILKAPDWGTPLLAAFKHFLSEHIRFDSDPDQGHGALSRHMTPDDRILPLWREFEHILIEFAPGLEA